MRCTHKARNKVSRFLMVLALLLVPLLTACTEEFIKAALGDPVPEVDGSEANLVTTEFDVDGGRVVLPNDIILAAVNAELPSADRLDGLVRTMPIRIPFNGPIDYPFAPGNNPSLAELNAWASSIFFFESTTPGTIIPALTTTTGGTFKAIYMDDNNDLVLVPGTATFANSAGGAGNGFTYVGVVTKDIKDTNGNPIQESVPMFLLKSTSSLVDSDGRSVTTLVDDEQAATLELIRSGGMSLLFTNLEGGGLPRENISLAFTFNVEPADSAAAITAALPGLEAAAAAVDVNPIMKWFDADNVLQDLPANAADFKSTFSVRGIPVGDIQAIYHGVYTCQNFLVPSGEDWVTGVGPAAVCPNSTDPALAGFIEFWLSIPAAAATRDAIKGIAVFQHGITRDSTDFAAIANALASAGVATIAIDIFAHGSMTFPISGEDGQFIRPDDPEKTVGYMLQSFLSIEHLAAITLNSTELQDAAVLNLSGAPGAVYFIGQSLGSILGALATASGATAFSGAVLNAPGADLVDIVLKGDIGAELIAAVAASEGLLVGSADLNALLLGIEMTSRHALFAGLVDPLAVYDGAGETLPATVLVQEMTGDRVIANDNTELLSRILDLTEHSDGGGATADARVRWTYNPGNYGLDSDRDPAGHGFLLDGETTATTQAQTQAVTYLLGAGVVDPSD